MTLARPVRQTEAQRHLAALDRLERIIAAFASMVSHQTRTSLVGIQGLSELIRDGELSLDEVRDFATDIFNEAQRIDQMIGEMFDLNRLETGQSSFRMAQVDLNRLVEEAAAIAPERTPNVGVVLEACAAPAIVLGDRDRLRQAVQRVVAFVAHAAQPGSIVAVTTVPVEDRVVVTIRSSSSRIVEFEDWLYGRYERYEQRPSAIFGAGLGLAIARSIVELHGGDIRAVLGADGGAEFQLTLPVPAASAEAPAPGPAPTPAPSPPPRRPRPSTR